MKQSCSTSYAVLYRPGAVFFNASCNEQVFFLLKKNLAQIRLVVFEKNAKTYTLISKK